MHSQYEEFNPFRSPSWRYERVLQLVDAKPPRLPSRLRDDRYVWSYRRFLLKWRNRTEKEREDLSFGEAPAIYYAHAMHNHADSEWRSIVEARILAGQSSAEIAHLLGTLPGVIHWYESLFFNVRDRLDRRDYIIKVILGAPADRNANSTGAMTDHQRDIAYKLFAYYGGPLVLELIISGLLDRPAPSGLDEVEPWLDSTFECMLRRNAMVAAQAMEVDRKNVMQLLEVNSRLVEARRQSEADGGTQTCFERNIAETLADIPWALGREGYDQLNQVEQKYARTAFEPRAADAMRLAAGEEPEHLKELAQVTLSEAVHQTATDKPVAA